METYYTVLIPSVPLHMRTKWHPDTDVGPFSVLSRGAFATETQAIEWARTNLNGLPYSVKRITY